MNSMDAQDKFNLGVILALALVVVICVIYNRQIDTLRERVDALEMVQELVDEDEMVWACAWVPVFDVPPLVVPVTKPRQISTSAEDM